MAQRAIDLSEGFAAAVERAGPSVLRVVRRRRPASATVWDAGAGLVITTLRAVSHGDTARLVTADGEEREAQVVGRDPGTDLAVLRTEARALVAATVREVDDLRVGHLTLALARPGASVRASLRIVGVLGRDVRTPWGGRLEHYVETDRGFPVGFAGGPLVDLEGRVIGIDTDDLLRGADLTVPAVTVRRVVDEILAHGAVRRGYLGVAVQGARLPEATAVALGGQPSGALLVRVDDASPAARAGLVLGDVLVALDGRPVAGADDVRELVAERGGREVELRLLRVGALVTAQATLGQR